ncbi:SDR family oxidoreductase [Cysteiniphilum sp. 6C5]|uniref:SDR family oxidoreductase n=1 Tax=unclassified Cysteiniphilum TaxID=2610889 RepID=UPI003F855003
MKQRKKTILVTGANRGIGLEFTKQYAQAGCNVIAAYRGRGESEGLLEAYHANKDNILLATIDVSRWQDFKELKKKLGGVPIDILINNAGVYPEQHAKYGIEDIPVQNLIEALSVNTVGAYRCIQSFLPNLLLAEEAKVINMSSQAGSISETKTGFGYSYRMSKAALNMLTRTFAADYKDIITVSLRPGWVKTDMGGDNATIEVSDSVERMISFISSLTYENSGNFYDLDGRICSW